MNSRKKQLAAAAVAVAAVCLSIIFVWMFGSLEQQKTPPEPTPSPVVEVTPTPTSVPSPKVTESPTPSPSPSLSPSPTPTPEPTQEPVYEPETDPEILEMYQQNTQEKEELEAQKKPAETMTEEDREEAEKPKQTPKPGSTPKPAKSVWLSDVPMIDQRENYPTGCESVSTVMACQYAGISITPDTFIDRYLPRASFTYENGKAIGYHPNDYFMGNPYTNNGFGCYAPCIEKAVNKFLPAGYTMVNITGKSLSSLCKTYLDKGIPVVTWATMYMVAPGKGASWILRDSGKTYQWKSHEHCLVLTGYDSRYYFFNDPLQGKVKYEKSLVETRYQQMGSQSLVIYQDPESVPTPSPTPKPTPSPTPTPTPSPSPTPSPTPSPEQSPSPTPVESGREEESGVSTLS